MNRLFDSGCNIPLSLHLLVQVEEGIRALTNAETIHVYVELTEPWWKNAQAVFSVLNHNESSGLHI